VDKTGGYDRTCIVVELLSDGRLDAAQLAYVQEQLEMTLARVLPSAIEKSQVITPDRFDPMLREGLRVS
jgi:hypothetical protein